MDRPGDFINSENFGPLISIITVVFNGEKYLEQTIQSVIKQSYKNIEYIVIDGASTDGSLEIINKYDDKIDCWLSEKDKGIADAMNKGISQASGEYILFLHSDDYLPNKQNIMSASQLLNDGSDLLICDILFGKDQTRVRPGGFSYRFRFRNRIPHQGLICRRVLFEKFGLFDNNLTISMDYEWLLRTYYGKSSITYNPIILSVMRDTGISSKKDWPSLRQRLHEEKKAQFRHCPSRLMKTVYCVFWLCYIPFRFMKAKLLS